MRDRSAPPDLLPAGGWASPPWHGARGRPGGRASSPPWPGLLAATTKPIPGTSAWSSDDWRMSTTPAAAWALGGAAFSRERARGASRLRRPPRPRPIPTNKGRAVAEATGSAGVTLCAAAGAVGIASARETTATSASNRLRRRRRTMGVTERLSEDAFAVDRRLDGDVPGERALEQHGQQEGEAEKKGDSCGQLSRIRSRRLVSTWSRSAAASS